jgi:hypothetical protein
MQPYFLESKNDLNYNFCRIEDDKIRKYEIKQNEILYHTPIATN